MALHIGLDDTDGRSGMCTSYIATELVRKLSMEYDIIGYPKLVRLNPNVPWKTRGNGALSVSIGHGHGKRFVIGSIGRRTIYGYENGQNPEITEELLDDIRAVIEENAVFEDPTTNPAFVLTSRRPARALYSSAIKSIVKRTDARRIAKACGAHVETYKNGRGMIGALAATAWTPRDATYEVLVYRTREMWGSDRIINERTVKKMDGMYPGTFNNYDHLNERVAIAPNSPCPILFGIRGDEVDELVPAMRTVRSEARERWIIFMTNQGTDDHLVYKRIPDVEPRESVIVKGTVSSVPKTIVGGHVIFGLGDSDGSIDATAYEPTKQFRNVVRGLTPGDRIKVYGGVRNRPRTINIEKMKIEKLAEVTKKVANPLCKRCNKRMKSVGSGKGYRCIKCGAKSSRPEMKKIKRDLGVGYYEPPVCARRHLSKPLKRMPDRRRSIKTIQKNKR